MRAVCGQTVLKFPTPDAASLRGLAGRWPATSSHDWQGHPLIVPAVAPHAPYTCTPEILRACADLAVEFDVPLHIHISETALEVEQLRERTRHAGGPVGQEAGPARGQGAGRALRPHRRRRNPHAGARQRRRGAQPVQQPQTGLRLRAGGGDARGRAATSGIGTDGPASNNDLDMFEEMRLAASSPRPSATIPPPCRPARRLPWPPGWARRRCTSEHLTGSLEPGKRADLILVDLAHAAQLAALPTATRTRSTPRLVYAAKSTDVTDVMVQRPLADARPRGCSPSTIKPLLTAAAGLRPADRHLPDRAREELAAFRSWSRSAGAEQEESSRSRSRSAWSDPAASLAALERAPFDDRPRGRTITSTTPTSSSTIRRRAACATAKTSSSTTKGDDQQRPLPPDAHRPARASASIGHSVLLSRSRFIAPATPQPALLPRVLQARPPSDESRKTAGAGWCATRAMSSSSISTRCSSRRWPATSWRSRPAPGRAGCRGEGRPDRGAPGGARGRRRRGGDAGLSGLGELNRGATPSPCTPSPRKAGEGPGVRIGESRGKSVDVGLLQELHCRDDCLAQLLKSGNSSSSTTHGTNVKTYSRSPWMTTTFRRTSSSTTANSPPPDLGALDLDTAGEVGGDGVGGFGQCLAAGIGHVDERVRHVAGHQDAFERAHIGVLRPLPRLPS